MKNTIEVQKEMINNLLYLIKENPELIIVPMVDSEVVCDDYGYWTASWGRATVEELLTKDDRYYVKSDSEDELIEDAMNRIDCKDEEELERLAKKEVDEYDWKKVIVVYIVLPS